jgi:hypothetical protein
VELEAEADPDEASLRVDEQWAVPSEVMHPEGLAITDGAAPIVADDLPPRKTPAGRTSLCSVACRVRVAARVHE